MKLGSKILFTLKDVHREKSLAQSYVDRYGHLIPSDVEIWEFDESDDPTEIVF